MGEEKQEKNKKKNEGDEKKGNNGETTVVLKVVMHCEGCAKKVRRSIKHFDGVESVKTDCGSNKLTVVGKVDPTKVKERVEEKIKKKVEIISPQPNKPSNKKDGGGGRDKKDEEKKSDGKSDEKKSEGKGDGKKLEEKKEKQKEPQVTTIVLKTRVHCEGCAQKIRRVVGKYHGVQDVKVDLQKDTITTKGTMNTKEFVPYLNSKLKRAVELVQPNKDGGGGDKKKNGSDKAKEGNGGGSEKKPKEGGRDKKEGDEEKKKKDGGEKNDGNSGENTSKIDVSKIEYNGYPSYGPLGYGFGFNYVYDPKLNGEANHGQYWHGPSHPPQMFSDENPNACSIM